MTIRVLIVDDSEFFQRELSSLLRRERDFEVIGSAGDGLSALHLAEDLKPDLVTLDVRMPVMDGMTTLKQIMTRRPVPTVMVSALTTDESHLTFDCLRYGAVDFVAKPSDNGTGSIVEHKGDIVATARRVAALDRRFLKFRRLRPAPVVNRALPEHPPRQIVSVAAGRGGLMSVLELLNRVPPEGDAAAIVSLDLAASVVESFSLYVSRFTRWKIEITVPEKPVLAGRAYLVPTTSPLILVREDEKTFLRPFNAPPGTSREHLLAALFRSAAEDFGELSRAVVLSGASRGALTGLESVSGVGGRIFVQSPESSHDPDILSEAHAHTAASNFADVATLSTTLSHEFLVGHR